MESFSNKTNKLGDFLTSVVALIIKADKIALETYILAELPFLANPFLKFFLDIFLNYISEQMSFNLQKVVASLVIDFQTNQEKSVLYKALKDLKKVQSENGSNALALKEAALNAAKNAWAQLIQTDGVIDVHKK